MKFQQEFSTKFKDENYHKIIDTGIFPFVYLKRRLEPVQNEAWKECTYAYLQYNRINPF